MFNFNLQLFAHKKGVGSTRNGRDSESKRLGVKRHAGQVVTAGIGSDDTIYAKIAGRVAFERKGRNDRQISVYPIDTIEEAI